MRHEFEAESERKQAPQPAPEQQVGDRERLAGAVGNSALARAASTGHAPPSLAHGAPMSVARSLSELDDAPEEISFGHSEKSGGPALHEAAHGEQAGAEHEAPAAVGAAETSAEHTDEDDEHGTSR
jgi:hypothetical protein